MESVDIFVASAGNEFMHDIACWLRDGWAASGTSARVLVDGIPRAGARVLQLIVAPHEFSPLFLARRLPRESVRALLGHTWAVNVEQPGSPWFDTAWEVSRECLGVFDISREGVAEFRKRGIAAHHAPLGYVQAMTAPASGAPAVRDIDVLFLGHASARRNAFFARHAAFFARHACRLVLADVSVPRSAATPGYLAGNARRRAAASARIVLNVHASDRTYFESHRALTALANGCLFVTERSRHTAPLVEDVHFVQADLDELPDVCERYLTDAPALDRIAQAGQCFVTEQMPITRTCTQVLTTAAAHADLPLASTRTPLDGMRSAVVERLRIASARAAGGSPPWSTTANDAWRAADRAAVSVVISLHDYEAFVRECIQSVLSADPVSGGTELVVVDDASTDGSIAVVEGIVEEAGLPVLLVRKALNTGPADTRNLGLRLARGRFAFVLDADNWIYPSGLQRLHAALEETGGAAAYGLLSRIDAETGDALGLLSACAWDPRALVREPYIDAMALFDREVVLSLGGYATDLVEHGWFGWEDYDLWLTLALADATAVLVPNLVGAYRVHGASMLVRTNQNASGLATHFRTKFARLVERYPGMDRYFGFPDTSRSGGPDVDALSLAALRTRARELQAEVDALRHSWSWRVTAPLRGALGLLRAAGNRRAG